jgi:2-methylcitrate dehydratase
MRDVLAAMIQAYEIQGVLALENSFNRVGLDHVILVKVATTAVVTRLLGGSHQQIIDALSHAWVDGNPLRTYRQSPNTGPRKSWAAGDATARGVWLALLSLGGESGIPSALSAPGYGFCDALFRGQELKLPRPMGSYVMENVLFKISAPAEFHAQTALEAAAALRPQVIHRLDEIGSIKVWTQEPALRIICKEGPLNNPADRDHCLQYIIAVGLLHDITAEHYSDAFHRSEPRIDALRHMMSVQEEPSYSRDYYDPEKRAIANAVQVFFKDGSATPRMEVQYPIGHRRRRGEGIPLLEGKFTTNLSGRFTAEQCQRLLSLFRDQVRLENTPVDSFMDLWTLPPPVHA